MIRAPLLAALTLLVAAPSISQSDNHRTAISAARSYRPIETIRWTYDDEGYRGGSTWQLRFSHDRSNSSMDADGDPKVQQVIDTIAHTAPGQAIAFSLTREAGTIACTGRAEQGGRGSGTCRFDPNDQFAAELARREIAPDDSDDLLALTMVDAHLATVDGLASAGFDLDDSGDLIAVSALHVTPAYASDLRQAGLRIDDLGDLIAARALKIDAQWLGEMAGAGYPDLAIGQAIQMRALGITPDYVRKMSRVLSAMGGIE